MCVCVYLSVSICVCVLLILFSGELTNNRLYKAIETNLQKEGYWPSLCCMDMMDRGQAPILIYFGKYKCQDKLEGIW